MKVIFLDHDGVICLSNNWGSRHKKMKKYKMKNPDWDLNAKTVDVHVRLDNFDTKAVEVLNEILETTGAEIVVSSDWKMHATLEELSEFYKKQGIVKPPIAFTPSLAEFDEETAWLFSWKGWLERARCLEIKKWLEENSVESWVAVDDLNMSNEFLDPGLDNFILTPRSNEGIKQSGIKERIVSHLI